LRKNHYFLIQITMVVCIIDCFEVVRLIADFSNNFFVVVGYGFKDKILKCFAWALNCKSMDLFREIFKWNIHYSADGTADSQ
jgi:hypothetical protein